MPTLTRDIIVAAIDGFEAQKQRIDEQIDELRAMLTPTSNGSAPNTGRPKRRRKMSLAGRRAIAEAQRKRWAAKRATTTGSKAPKRAKRKLSPEGRAAIVAALKKRWAAKTDEADTSKKASRKKTLKEAA